MIRSNPIVIFLALLLTAAIVGSFASWMSSDPGLMANTERRVFFWLLVASDVFLLVTRAFREYRDRR